MNIIQKHKSKIAKVYLNREDTVIQASKIADGLIDFLTLTPLDYSIQVHLDNLEDISIEFTGLLISLIKTANTKKMSITLVISSKLADLLLNLGTGNLGYSIELSPETT